jgi:hypothetical protein
MFDASEDASPITTIQSFINNPSNLEINPVPAQNPVVNLT